jgi:CheY-like chemotaxis protein
MSRKVLVIDDEPDIRMLTRMWLELEGHTVVEAESGEDGLALLSAESPDVIFLDIRLPGIDGWEVLRRIRKEDTSAVVIMMSAHSSGHTLDKAKAEGSTGYLIKPFKRDDILGIPQLQN